jgi:diguanylate cyclase (GGDEF)-like protein
MVDGLLGQLDFIIAVPVFRPGESPEAGARPANWVAATVNEFDAVLERPFAVTGGQLGANLTVRIDNPDVAADEVERVAESPNPPGPLDDADFDRTDTFAVQGLELSLTTWSSPDAANEGVEAVAFTLLAGIIASLLGASVVYLRGRSLKRERALAELDAATERAQLQSDILASVTDAVVVLDGDGNIVTANAAWDRLRDRDPSEGDRPGPDDDRRYIDAFRELSPLGAEAVGWALAGVLTGETESSETDVPVDLAGRRLWKAVSVTRLHGASGGAVVVHRDITQRKASEESLSRRASQDPLTGLLNRSSFEDAARLAVGQARDTGAPVGALFIDLDDFKYVNDTYSHAVGDGVLQAVAKRISNAVRADDAVARHGGDEFVVLLRDLTDAGTADVTATRILQSLQEPIRIGDVELIVGASIGVVVLRERAEMSVAALLSLSDQAMYAAKDRGGSRFVTAN